MPGVSGEAAFRAEADGLRLAVRVTPRGGRSGLQGLGVDAGGRAVLRVRLAAAPVDGAANAALLDVLAAGLGVRRSAVTIRAGQTGRTKIVHVAGDGAALCARVTTWIKAAADEDG